MIVDFTLTDPPILTPAACEGTSTLLKWLFGDQAYLTRVDALHREHLMALGKVYRLGLRPRGESKTRRHLTEFWMVDPESLLLNSMM